MLAGRRCGSSVLVHNVYLLIDNLIIPNSLQLSIVLYSAMIEYPKYNVNSVVNATRIAKYCLHAT